MSQQQAVVIDNGTGYTKVGYAGNLEPQFVFPTVIALHDDVGGRAPRAQGPAEMRDLDFLVGDEALEHKAGFSTLSYPMKEGKIENWDQIERMWEHCFFKYLRCEPEEQLVLLTEPPMNPPENREYVAEIMFETFNVRGLHIAVQAVLAMAASWGSKKAQRLGLRGSATGTVIDSGDGVTHVIPVADGFVIGSAIKHIPLAGNVITRFVRQLLMDREKTIPSEDALTVAQKVKEEYSYICRDLAAEFNAYDTDPSKVKQHTAKTQRGESFTFDVAFEQFLGPELFFSPEIFSSDWTTPLPEVVDQAVQQCPIDYRRGLYRNIVLSGGSTMFTNFDKRLQRDIKHIVQDRIDRSMKRAGLSRPAAGSSSSSNSDIEVNVISHDWQRYAVWCGGSQLATLPQFGDWVVKKAEYDEIGPSICRQNRFVFSALTV